MRKLFISLLFTLGAIFGLSANVYSQKLLITRVDEQLTDVWLYDLSTKTEKQLTQSHNAHCGKWLNKNEVIVISNDNIWKINLRNQSKKQLSWDGGVISLDIDPQSSWIVYERIDQANGELGYSDILALDLNFDFGADVIINNIIGPISICCFAKKIFYSYPKQNLYDSHRFSQAFIQCLDLSDTTEIMPKKTILYARKWNEELNLNERILQITYNNQNKTINYLTEHFQLNPDGSWAHQQYFIYEKPIDDQINKSPEEIIYNTEKDKESLSSFCWGTKPNQLFLSLFRPGQHGRAWLYNYDQNTKALTKIIEYAQEPALQPIS